MYIDREEKISTKHKRLYIHRIIDKYTYNQINRQIDKQIYEFDKQIYEFDKQIY